MANQQLIDYIQEQLKKGISQETVKKVVLAAGWAAPDVDEALRVAQGQQQPVVPAVSAFAVSPALASASPTTTEITPPTTPVASVSSPASATPAAFAMPTAAAISTPAMDIFPQSSQPAVQPASSPAPSLSDPLAAFQMDAQPQVAPFDQSIIPKLSSTKESHSSGLVMKVLPWILFVVALVAAGFLYTQNNSLQQSATSLTQQGSQTAGSLQTLTQTKSQLTQQVATLTQENADLNTQLATFAPPQSTSTTPVPLTLNGMIGFVDGGYTLTTPEHITFTITNTKDVDATLKPLVGASVVVSGTHAPTSRDIVVTMVNNAPLAAAAGTSASSTATSSNSR